MQRFFVVFGLLLVLIGVAWPLIERSGLGRLPGDFVLGRGNFRLYVPLATSLLLSILLSLVLWLLRR
ncbi:MAG TPA: DUF2905 domain-containing protein [Stellaceae bacterium]|nr:DUF2905 domain-containing protein [Stellaceae bacterium]